MSKSVMEYRKKKVKELKENGVINAWYAVRGGKPKTENNLITSVGAEGRVVIPSYIRKKMNIKKGDVFNIKIENEKIILWRG